MITALEADVVFLSETKQVKNELALVEGYVTIANNRTNIHCDATGGSGGTAFLIKKDVLNDYHVSRQDHNVEGILLIKLKHKITEKTITILGVYQPPETSVHCEDPDAFFQHLLGLTYEHVNDDLVVYCGDFNVRTSDRFDYIDDIDDIPRGFLLMMFAMIMVHPCLISAYKAICALLMVE